MKISIALATYNGARFLQEQLNSLVSQTLLPNELVVCDDNSTDETVNIIANFKSTAPFEVRILKNEVNIGYTKNFEKAMSLCTGDLIFLCDQDDFWFSNKIMLIQQFTKNYPQIPYLIINDAVYTDIDLNHQCTTVLEKTRQTVGANHIPVNGACSAISKEFRDFLVPFPPDLRTNYDTYIHRWGRLLGNIILIDSVLQAWRIHGKNVTSNEMSLPKNISIYQLYKKYRTSEVVEDYIAYKEDVESMLVMLNNKSNLFQRLNLSLSSDQVLHNLDEMVKSYNSRIKLLEAGFIFRKINAFQMLIAGQYRYFRGFKSFLKDVLR